MRCVPPGVFCGDGLGHHVFSYLEPKPASVKIYNQITIGAPIQGRCRSRTNILVIPEMTLQNGGYVGWALKPSIWGYTRFNCDFKWEIHRKYQAFDVWVDVPLEDILDSSRLCTHCEWHVVLEGFKEYEATVVLGNPVAERPCLVRT